MAQLRNAQTPPAAESQEPTADDVADMIDNDIEYKWSKSSYQKDYNTKMLLPIKTKRGIERRYTDVIDDADDTGISSRSI